MTAIFLVCALPTGLCLALLTPIGQVADEPAHIARAAGLLHGQIMGQRFTVHDPAAHESFPFSGTMVNSALVPASLAELPPKLHTPLSRKRVEAARAIPWSHTRQMDGAPNTVQYFPALYVPGTIGIAAARWCGASPLQALYAGRIAMLLSYLALGTAAVALAAFGQGLLFALLNLPMALSLGASFNQDGQLIAASALTGALLTLDPRLHPRLRFLALPIFALVLMSKPPYGLLLFAALLPLARPGLLRRAAVILLFALPPVIWVALMMHDAQVPYHRTSYLPGPLWPGDPHQIFHGTDPAASLRVLLAKPSRFIHLPVQFLIIDGKEIIREAIGILGWLSVSLGQWAYDGWYIALGMAALGILASGGGSAVPWRAPDALLVLALVILSVFAVEIAIYLSWDDVGAATISGPQGRYYLLFIPFLILALPRLALRQGADNPAPGSIEALLAMPAIVMALIDTGYLPWLIVHKFYLR